MMKSLLFRGRGLDRQKTAHKEKLLMLPTSPQWTSGEKEKLSVSLKKIRRKLSPPTCVLCIHVTINEHKIVSIFFFGFSLFILAHHPSHTQPTNKSFTPFAMGEKKEPPYLVVHTFTLSLTHSGLVSSPINIFYMLTTVDRKHQPQSSVYLPILRRTFIVHSSAPSVPYPSSFYLLLNLNTIEIFCIFLLPFHTYFPPFHFGHLSSRKTVLFPMLPTERR